MDKGEEVTLPKATVNKMIKEKLPSNVKCSGDTRELLVQCCIEYIQLLSSEANEVCEKSNKKTIAPDHVVVALKNLGYDKYVADVEATAKSHRQLKSDRPKEKDKLKNLTAEQMEDLKRQQMVMFQKARSSLSCSQQSATSNKSTDSHASQETANRSEKKELEDEEDIEMDEYSDHDDGEPDADGDESAPTSSMRQSTGGLDVEDDDYDFDDEE